MLIIVERDKLNYVSFAVSTILGTVECLVVAVQLLHVAEIRVTHADDDDGERICGATHDLVNRLTHVVDDSVGDD